MKSMGSDKRSRPRRSFTAEFKAEIVVLCQRGDRSVAQVARDFDLTETAVREWVKQAERDTGVRADGGLTSTERDELAALRRENRRLARACELLQVSRSAYYQQRDQTPSDRDQTDADLTARRLAEHYAHQDL